MDHVLLKRNLIAYLVAGAISLVALGSSAYLLTQSTTPTAASLLQSKASLCEAEAKNLRLVTRTDAKTNEMSLHYYQENIEDGVYLIHAAIASCVGHTLKSFCAGEACERKGVSAILVPKN